MVELLGQHFSIAWAGQTGQHKHRVSPSLQQSLLAATSHLRKKCCHSCDTGLVILVLESKGSNTLSIVGSNNRLFLNVK